MFATILFFCLGLVVLVCGAEALVRGAVRLAALAGVSPLVIGLTVVAYGTSAPEMAVSLKAALAGEADLALGNVVGSNIFNVLFILGASAAITPLVVHRQLLRQDLWVMLVASGATYVLGRDGIIGQAEGWVLATGFGVYTIWSVWRSRIENASIQQEFAAEFGGTAGRRGRRITVSVLYVLVGLGLLVLGARWLLDAAVAIASSLGVSELFVGLTIVAAGTSFPELATSVVAAIRGHRDIAVGNVVGSNIFNILAVLGLSALTAEGGAPVPSAALSFDIPVMVVVAAVCLPIFYTARRIDRWEGWLFLIGYAGYTAYLIKHSALVST